MQCKWQSKRKKKAEMATFVQTLNQKQRSYIILKGSTQHKNTAIINIHASNIRAPNV